MNIDLLLKIAGVGILIAVLHQILTKAGRDDQAMTEERKDVLSKFAPLNFAFFKSATSKNA